MGGTAIIGLGAMGMGMARNIMAAGIELRGFDLSKEALERFAKAGGKPFASASEAVDGCDLLLLMVVNGEQARAALFDTGVAEAMAPGATVVLSSTVAPSEARSLAEALEKAGHQLLDAPVSGGQVGAEAGSLTIMASGSEAAFARAQPVLEAVSGIIHKVGDTPGLGATYKVVHQLAAGVHLVAAAELMALGVNAGCDAKTLFEIVSGAAGQSWMFKDRAPRMMQADPPVTSTVEIFIKDVGLVLQTGKDTKTPLPMTAAAHQMLVAAAGLGHGREDDSAVVRAYEALTGKKVHES